MTEFMNEKTQRIRTQAHVVYGLYAASFFFWPTSLIGVILAYVAKRSASIINDDYLIQHFNWQIKTFWIPLLLLAVSFFTFLILATSGVVKGTVYLLLLGIISIILLSMFVWSIYRIIKGWVTLINGSTPN